MLFTLHHPGGWHFSPKSVLFHLNPSFCYLADTRSSTTPVSWRKIQPNIWRTWTGRWGLRGERPPLQSSASGGSSSTPSRMTSPKPSTASSRSRLRQPRRKRMSSKRPGITQVRHFWHIGVCLLKAWCFKCQDSRSHCLRLKLGQKQNSCISE